MIFENKIISHFETNWIKRNIEFPVIETLKEEDRKIITEIGLPHTILDFNFEKDIYTLSKSEIVIGETIDGRNIILNVESGNIVKDNHNFFLAKSLKNFVFQLYIYDSLWKNIIPNKEFGNYREDHNHKKYALFLEKELLIIDPDLLKNDNSYFWGSLIEDIEFGIVG